MKIAITGVSGQVGNNLARALLNQQKYEIRGLVYKDLKAVKGLDLEIVQGHLHDRKTLKKLCDQADVVFHLAALISIGKDSYSNVYRTNVEGTKNLVQIAKSSGVKKLIYFSSVQALVQEPAGQVLDETRKLAVNSKIAYEKTKALAEKWVLEQKSDNFEVVVLSPTSVIGPFDFKPSLIGQFLIKLYKNKLPALISGGYDWVDVRDIVNAAITAIEKGRNGERYLLSGRWSTLYELAVLLGNEQQNKVNMPVLPRFIALTGIPFIRFWAKISGTQSLYTKDSVSILKTRPFTISCEKAVRELDYSPRSLKESLKDTVTWFKENHYI